MRRVTIQKITHDESQSIVALGKAYEGLEPLKPAVGKEYYIFDNAGGILKTSPVVKVMNGLFETRNSFYKVTVLEEEPFDLRGKDDERPMDRTREIVLPKVMLERN
jgi:hypothetical protein